MKSVKKNLGLLTTAVLLASFCIPGSALAFFGGWFGSDVRDEAFEIIGTKYVYGLADKTVAEKRAIVQEIAEHLVEHSENSKIFVPEALRGETALKFPYMDMNLDGVADEASFNVEFWHEDNTEFLADTGVMEYMAALPWPLAIHTDGNYIKAALRIPESSIRVFLRPEDDTESYEELAAGIREDMESMLRWDLRWLGFSTWHIDRIEASSITEPVIAAIEEQIGEITVELAAPGISFPANGRTVEEVLTALETAINTPRVADLDMDGVPGTAADKGVLPAMLQGYANGDIPFCQIVGMFRAAPYFWNQGFTFQQWKSVKVLAVDAGTNMYQVSVCQPFYAQTAVQLTGTMYHQTIMPCRMMVWVEDDQIHMVLSNPEVFFALFFFDAAAEMDERMQKLFRIFPTFVLNEMATLINSAAEDVGTVERMSFKPTPPTPECD